MRVCITNGSHHPVLLAPSQNKLLSISMEDDQQQSSVSINGSQHKLGAFVIPQSIRSSSVRYLHACLPRSHEQIHSATHLLSLESGLLSIILPHNNGLPLDISL